MAYVTPVRRGVALPIDFGPGVQILIVLLSTMALGDAEIWRRLIAADLPQAKYSLVLCGAPQVEDLKELLPPSLHAFVQLDVGIDWLGLTGIDAKARDRVLALAVAGREARVIMVGRPTEDAWDEFCRAAG